MKLHALLLTSTALAFASCATAPMPPAPAVAKTRTGQLRYAGRESSFIAEFTMRQAPGDLSLEIGKAGGVSLFTLRDTPRQARFEGGGRVWQGDPAGAPKQIQTWLALDDILSGRPGLWRVRKTGLRTEIDFPAASERFVFVFAP